MGIMKRSEDKAFKMAFDYLDNRFAYFLTNVIRLGRPKWTTSLPTAAVAVRGFDMKMPQVDNGHLDFEFLFNPDFGSALETDEFAFIIAHETMHIVLNHLKLVNGFINRKRYNEIRKKVEKDLPLDKQDIKDSIKLQQMAAKFNIAADCVINDYLVQAGFDPPVVTERLKQAGLASEKAKIGDEMLCRGMNYIGEDAAFLTVREVYDRLPEQKSGDSGGEGDEQQQAMGIGNEDGRGSEAMDMHNWMFDPDFADKVADAIDQMNKAIEQAGGLPTDLQDKRDEEAGKMPEAQQRLQQSMRAGSQEGNIRKFQEVNGLELGWVNLLKEVDPDMFKEPGLAPPPRPAWHKRPRKLHDMQFKDLNLPVYTKDVRREKRSNEKPAIVMALDYSGSIGPGDADRFATLALSIPRERIKLFTCTFTTTYKVFDPENPHGGGHGGTDFNAIVDFIDTEVKPQLNGKYPKAVVVITDGCASLSKRPTDEEAKGWFWLMSPYPGYSGPSHQIGRYDDLRKYIV